MIESYFSPFAALKESIDDSFYNVYEDSPPAVHLAKNVVRGLMWAMVVLAILVVYFLIWCISDLVCWGHHLRATLLSIPVMFVIYTIIWALYTLDNA